MTYSVYFLKTTVTKSRLISLSHDDKIDNIILYTLYTLYSHKRDIGWRAAQSL